MKIELRKVQHAKFASEETDCFTATVVIDGVAAGNVSNDGRGGSNRYYPESLYDRLQAHAETLPPTSFEHGGEKVSLPMDADLLIGELFEGHVVRKELTTLLKRRVLFTSKERRGIFKTSTLDPDRMRRALDDPHRLIGPQVDKVLNSMPFEDALALFRAQA